MTGEQRVERLRLGGQIADLLPDAIGGLIRHPKLALEFLAADTVARRAEQIHGVEPANQRGARVVQDGVGGGVHMVAARRANKGAALRQLVEGRVNRAALGAVETSAAEPDLHDVREASVVVGEALEELANAELGAGRGAFLRHAIVMAQSDTCVKGINGNN